MLWSVVGSELYNSRFLCLTGSTEVWYLCPMRGIAQFEPYEIKSVLSWYVTCHISAEQVCETLNRFLRDKAEQEREKEAARESRPHRPNCF